MKGSLLIVILCGAMLGAWPVVAQQRPVAPAAQPEAQGQLRHQISVMEDVLERAVQYGAQRFNEQLRTARMPDFLLAGAARAHGTRLEGYGIFFDLEVPFVRQSLAWSFRVMDRPDPVLADQLSALRRMAQAMTNPPMKASLESIVNQLEARLQNAAPRVGGGVSAATVPGAAPSLPLQRQLADNPAETYTNEVRKAVIDAMLDYSGPMSLRADEWLTVAARDGFPTTDPNDVPQTMIIQARGADLLAFREGRLAREEAVKRVEVKDF